MVTLNEAYTRVEFRLEREGFDNVPALIRFYVGNRKPVSQVSVAGRGSVVHLSVWGRNVQEPRYKKTHVGFRKIPYMADPSGPISGS